MSLEIAEENVRCVLLADGWHDVIESTFVLDAYEFADKNEPTHLGGQSGICATGFKFSSHKDVRSEDWPEAPDKVVVLCGPLTSIIAIETNEVG